MRQISPHHLRCHMRQAGFTVVELCLGLLVTTLVMSAVAAFSLAMARSWENGGRSQSLSLSASQLTQRLQHDIRDARRLGACQSGSIDPSASVAPAAVAIWLADSNSDRKIQSSELQVLQHDPAQRLIRRLRTKEDAAPVDVPLSTFNSSGVFELMASLETVSEVIASNVTAARFCVSPGDGASHKPSLQYGLQLQRYKADAGSAQVESSYIELGTATLRAPAKADEPVS